MKSSRVCRKSSRKTSRITCNSSCKMWSKGSTISCQNIRKCRKDRKIYKASRPKEENCRETVPHQKRRCGSSKRSLSKRRSAPFFHRTKSIRIRCRMQKWRQSFRVCRREKNEEAVMLRTQVIAARRPCGSNLSPWRRMDLTPVYKGPKEKWERHKGRCRKRRRKKMQ